MGRRYLPLVALAVAAGVGTVGYLWPVPPQLVINLIVALAILAVPLWRWLPTARHGRIVAAWVGGGLLGAYVFGTPVLAAGLLAGLGLAARRCCRGAMWCR